MYTGHSVNVSQQHSWSAALREVLIKESERCQGKRQFTGRFSLVFLVWDLHGSVASRGGEVTVLFLWSWYSQV